MCAPTARAAASTSASVGLGTRVGDGVANRAGEQVRLLRNDAQPVAVVGGRDGAQVGAAHADRPRRRVVIARDELDQSRLAGAGLTDQGDRLPRRDGERNPATAGVFVPRVSEDDVVDLQRSEVIGQRHRVLGRRHRGRRAQQIADTPQAHLGLLVTVEHLRQLLHRSEEQVEIEQVRDQAAGGEACRCAPARRRSRAPARRRPPTASRRTGSRWRCSAAPAAGCAGIRRESPPKRVGVVAFAAERLRRPAPRRPSPGSRR